MEIAGEEVGSALPIVNGVWADGSLEAARIARHGGSRRRLGAAGVSAGAVHDAARRRRWRWRISSTIADATDLPIIVFQYPLATGQGYPHGDAVKTVRARCRPSAPSRTGPAIVQQHERQIRTLQGLQASGQRALHPQRLADELAGARLQRALVRQRQRDRRSAGAAVPCRQGQRSRRGAPAQRPHLSDRAGVLCRSLHRHAQPHEGGAGAAGQAAARGGAPAAGEDRPTPRSRASRMR